MIERVRFLSRRCAENCEAWPDFAPFSLNEPDAKDGEAVIKEGWHDVLRLGFHDITPDMIDLEQQYTLVNDDQAKQIVDFVRRVAPNVEGIIVHCRAGVSRSAAVAKWISGEYGIPFNASCDRYNAFLYRLLGRENEKDKK